MRVTAGAFAVLGLAVAVAEAQPGKERAAALKAPQALSADELPPVARGAVGDFPTTISGTPVARSGGATVGTAPPGPAWLTGDTGVAPAGGISTKASAVRPLGAPPALGKDERVPPPPKMLDRLKIFPNDKAPAAPEPQPVAQTAPQTVPPPAPQPTAATAFRGTGTNGAPVFAGPPAYRWYGWGSVTPGANPLAPTGQYPKASANWYQITGATPGAFPVPVTAGARGPAGTEPPTYGLAARTPAPTPVVTVAAPAPTLPPVIVERPEPSKFPAPPETKTIPAPTLGALPPSFSPPAVPVPALTPPPIPTKSAAVSPTLPPAPVTVLPPAPPKPELPPPPIPPKTATVAPAPVAASVAILPPPDMAIPPLVPSVTPDAVVPSVAPAVPVSVAPPSAPAKPAVPATLPVEPKPTARTPSPLPTSVTADPPRDEAKWKQSSETAPRPGTWAPATAPNLAPLPTTAVEPPGGWQSGAAPRAVVARGQLNDGPADPIDALIKQMCQGRAVDVEVRHTGTKKIQVCFEARTADDAKKLVSDISKRPELTPYQVDFCVLVK